MRLGLHRIRAFGTRPSVWWGIHALTESLLVWPNDWSGAQFSVWLMTIPSALRFLKYHETFSHCSPVLLVVMIVESITARGRKSPVLRECSVPSKVLAAILLRVFVIILRPVAP